MIKVLKFGGSSLISKDTRVHALQHIVDELKINQKVVVVVSAMGRLGDNYATDTLKGLVKGASKADTDLLMSCGEIISCCVLSSELKELGINSKALNTFQTGIKVTSEFSDANVIDVDVSTIMKLLQDYDVLVVPGFQGITKDDEIATLGRGGSDFSAIILGDYLESVSVDIFSDVKGVMTANPKEIDEAKLIKKLHYSDLISLAYQGASVVHHKAVEYAYLKQVNLRFRSTFKNGIGTIVFNNSKSDSFYSLCSSSDKAIIEIFSKKDRYVIKNFYQELSNHDFKISLLHLSMHSIQILIDKINLQDFIEIVKENNFLYKVTSEIGRISIVTNSKKDKREISLKVLKILIESEISVHHIDISKNTISLIVDEKALKKSMNILHTYFSE